jgi:hypothetical protein
MEMIRIAGTTREMAKHQKEYATLCIRDDIIRNDKIAFHCMVSAWQPTPEELAALNAGAPIYLSIFNGPYPPDTLGVTMVKNSQFPPVRLYVGDTPEITGG